MIDKLLSLLGIHRTGLVFGIASNIIKAFDTEFGKDIDAKNAAIDSVVAILLSYKDSVKAAPATPPAITNKTPSA